MTRLDYHIAAVRRKLALGIFIEWLAVAGFVLAALALMVILSHKAIHMPLPLVSLWVGLGAVAGVAVVMTGLRMPDRHAAAVAIDERLALKEKFSTALHVRVAGDDEFAAAVLHDASRTAERVNLGGKFPISFPRMGGWAMGVGMLAALAMWLIPPLDLFGREKKVAAKRQEQARVAETRMQIRETLAKIETAPKAAMSNEDLKIAKAELEKMLGQPVPDPAKAARQRVEALSKLDQALKNQVAQNQRFAQAQKNATEFRAMKTPPIDAKGPVSEAHRDLAKGKFEESLADLKKAAEDFKDAPPEKKKESAEAMQKMADALNSMAQDPRAQQKMADQLQQLGADKNEIQQAKDLVQKAAQGDQTAQQKLQQMAQQMAQQMNNGQGANQQQTQQLQQALQQAQQAAAAQGQAGQMGQAAQQLAQAMQQAAQGNPQPGNPMAQNPNMQQLQDALNQLEGMQQDAQQMDKFRKDVQDDLAKAGGQCDNPGPGDGKKPGDGKGQNPVQGKWDNQMPDQQGNGQGNAGIGQGGQGQKTVAPHSSKAEKSASDYDERGEHLASVYIKDRAVRGEYKGQLKQKIEATAGTAGDDVDDSRASAHSRKVQKDYFKAMSEAMEGQK